LDDLDPHRHNISRAHEIRIAIVKPLPLDEVCITVERNFLHKIDEVQERFGGGFEDAQPNGVHGRGRPKPRSNKSRTGSYWNTSGTPHERLMKVIREAVSGPQVIRAGDTLILPLPSHPITHIPPPPAIISACKPVKQGLISMDTKIILIQAGVKGEKISSKVLPAPAAVRHILESEAEDTSNEQFYSAAEDRESEADSAEDDVSETSDTGHSSQHGSDDVSDDSLEDMISLSVPGLSSHLTGTLSATHNATPRPGDQRPLGIHTPGSVYSTYTAAKSRAGTRPGKVCRAEALLHKIPRQALHPKPSDEDDDQAFIFVNINTLTKIGCFSGDWVRVEKAKRPSLNGILSLDVDSMGEHIEETPQWRAVRLYGLSNLAQQKPRYAIGDKHPSAIRSSSFDMTPAVYIPPVLLHNLGSPSFVKLSGIPKAELAPSTNPPIAKEVTLSKISTPLAIDKEVQLGLFAGLKQHFEQCSRIVKAGDLIATVLDEDLSRTTFNGAPSADTGSDDAMNAHLEATSSIARLHSSVAWFKVDQVVKEETDSEDDHFSAEDPWGGVVIVDRTNTRTAQSGNRTQGIPETLVSNTATWFHLRNAPWVANLLGIGSSPTAHKPQLYVGSLQKRLADLISASTSSRAETLGLPPLAVLLHSTQRQIGKTYIASAACAATATHEFILSAHDLLTEGGSANGGGDVKTEVLLKTRAERGLSCGSHFTSLLITHLEMLTADRMVSTLHEIINDSRILIATTTELEKVPDGIRSLFTHEFEVNAPDEAERKGILYNACLQQALRLDQSVDLGAVALKTAALVAGDLVDVVQRASLAKEQRLEKLAEAKGVSMSDIRYSGGSFACTVNAADFNEAIARARSTFSDSIGAPKIPTVTWQDVGGLAEQKSSIMETISLPLSRPELFAKGMRKRSGILFYGPPGTGKTLLAKAIATEFSLNFFSVKGPELLNMYIGESEANVRRVFQRARDARPCVVFFDELDSVAPKRGNQGDSGGVMDRIVSQLLAELDGMSSGGSSKNDDDGASGGNAGGVFVIGATNRPDLLDPALLRPGRFDKMLYLGVSSTHEQQLTILEALTRKFLLAPDVDLRRVASRLPLTYTGADLYALCSDAMLKAITKKTKQVDTKVQEASKTRGEKISTAYYFDHLATPDDIAVVVGEDDFVAAQKELVASVRYDRLSIC
jgi:peroxin-6